MSNAGWIIGATIGAAGIAAGATLLFKTAKEPESTVAPPVAIVSTSTPLSVGKISSPSPRPVQRVAKTENGDWSRFKAKFGSTLEPGYDSNGVLVSLRGRGLAKSDGAFDSTDPQNAISRAAEILKAAANLLGITPDSPFSDPLAKPGARSAQVSYRQTADGVPIEPGGKLSIDLGAAGELLSLYSSYVPAVHLTNSPELDPERTGDIAKATASQNEGNLRVEGGTHVIWIVSTTGDASGSGAGSEGRHAYSYFVQGHQIVVDAQTGKILFKKDIRTY